MTVSFSEGSVLEVNWSMLINQINTEVLMVAVLGTLWENKWDRK